jgi:uncharacterized protein YukJ
MGTGLDKGYGVLKCRVVDRKMEREDKQSPHYQVHVKDDEYNYRIAINVRSVKKPFDLLYFLNDNFKHPITDELLKLDFGFHKIEKSEQKAGGIALDYIRYNLFDVRQMKPLPPDVDGKANEINDLNDLIDLHIKRALESKDAVIYAFGEPWGLKDEDRKPEDDSDKIFGFKPGRGIHNIHMNQGSSGNFAKENGVYQDGALLIHFPSRSQWVAGFFAFQSQSFHTDNVGGDPLPNVPGQPVPLPDLPPVEAPMPDGKVRIVAALVNPPGDDPGKETVTLLNASPETVDLNGWAIADRLKRKYPLKDISLNPGVVVTVPLTGENIQLGNNGAIITLLDSDGVKIDGVSYTKEDANKQGWTIVF